jgi:hypothetical protein
MHGGEKTKKGTTRMSYQQSRNWADQYDAALCEMAAYFLEAGNLVPIEFRYPSLSEDRKAGIDMWMQIDPIKLAFRVRDASTEDYFFRGFTIRTSGNPSELSKVLSENYADYLLYALAHPDIPGELQAGFLLDMKSVGAQLTADKTLLAKATRGSSFVELPYQNFWKSPVVVGHVTDDKPSIVRTGPEVRALMEACQ